MDAITADFHPNWYALATINLRLKRFVRANEEETRKSDKKETHKLINLNGSEIKEFYETIIKEESPVQKIIKAKTNCAIVDKKVIVYTPFDAKRFFQLAITNNVKELQKLDYTKADINITDSYGWTALMMSSCEGAKNAVRFLLELGCDKFIEDRARNTALDLAVKKGHSEIAKLLRLDDVTNKVEKKSTENVEEANTKVVKPFYCKDCNQLFHESTQQQHESSTVHLFNRKSTIPPNKLQKFNIPIKNRGLQLMLKQGWDKQSGLGPSQKGRLYPIKTVLRKKLTGLGIEQDVPRVTHFGAFDIRATQHRDSKYYKKKARNRNDIMRERHCEWKRERRLRKELS